MRAHAFASVDDDRRDEDPFVVRHGVSWSEYLQALDERGEHSAPRIAYLEGLLEIMSPGKSHERLSRTIGYLIGVWCAEHDIKFTPFGAWTLQDKRWPAALSRMNATSLVRPERRRRVQI